MTARRSFLARFGAAAAAFGFGSAAAGAQEPAAPQARPAATAGSWQPARHEKDDWLDAIPGKHRLFFDAVSPEGAAAAAQFAGNFFSANKSGYELGPSDLAVVICLRHRATQFAFTDAIWAKYGAALAESEKFVDPKTSQAPTVNLYKRGLEANIARGVHLAICDLSTHRMAGFIARKIENGSAEAIYKELTANAFGNAHFVAAGILAVNRAQERGYSIASVG